jgi:Response regulator containing a CheY-like receiver domain and an HTH DNA-binding domain
MMEDKDQDVLRVLVVDDHRTFAELLTQAIDREPDLVSVGHATTGAGGVAMFAQLRPDVVLMDVQLPDIDGFVATAQIVAMSPGVRVIMLSAHATATVVDKAVTSGACGFVAKDGHFADMLNTIRTARPGALAVDPALVTRLIDKPATVRPTLARPLSQRELSVLVRMADGRDVTRIAHEMDISSHTCRGHVKSVLSKLGAHSQLEAVIIAVRIGLIQISDQPAKAVGY